MRPITLIVIHCSASPNGDSLFRPPGGLAAQRGQANQLGFQTPVQTIDAWHAARGFKRTDTARALQNPDLKAIGYHFVIYTNGAVVTGRGLDEIGAHVAGFNQKSLGICMVGADQFSPEQWQSLADLVHGMQKKYPEAKIVGHRDLSPDANGNGVVESFEWLKTCPGFDVAAWLANGMQPTAKGI